MAGRKTHWEGKEWKMFSWSQVGPWMSHELRISMYFQMLSDIKHFSHYLQITAESSRLIRGGNRAKESLQGWFNNSILQRFKSASSLHAPLLCIILYQSLSCNPHFLQPICMHFFFFFCTKHNHMTSFIWFITFLFLYSYESLMHRMPPSRILY